MSIAVIVDRLVELEHENKTLKNVYDKNQSEIDKLHRELVDIENKAKKAEIDRLTAEDAACGCKCEVGKGKIVAPVYVRNEYKAKCGNPDCKCNGENDADKSKWWEWAAKDNRPIWERAIHDAIIAHMSAFDTEADNEPDPTADLTKDEQIAYPHGVIDGMERGFNVKRNGGCEK